MSNIYGLDIYGNPIFNQVEQERIAGMSQPARCTWCRGVYDLGTVKVTARYTDCSMWRCPCCNQLVDDRGETGWKSRPDYTRIPRRRERTEPDAVGDDRHW